MTKWEHTHMVSYRVSHSADRSVPRSAIHSISWSVLSWVCVFLCVAPVHDISAGTSNESADLTAFSSSHPATLPFDKDQAIPLLVDARQPLVIAQSSEQTEDTSEINESNSPMSGALQTRFAVHRDLGMTALQARQYEQAREQFMSALELNPQDANLLYHLSIVEFNLGNTTEARERLRQAHSALSFSSGRTIDANVAELQMEGEYSLIPVRKDGWDLRLKEDASLARTYPLDVDSVYQFKVTKMENEGQTSFRSSYLLSIPIGLMLVWVFAR